MRALSNSARALGYGETSWETGKFTKDSEREIQCQILKIENDANSVPLSIIFRYYHHNIVPYGNSICPFPSHKLGRERTPSFKFYEETNSFNCFGCQKSGSSISFVKNFEGITTQQAINKIFKIFKDDFSEVKVESSSSIEELLEFSDLVREFHLNHTDENSFNFIEGICYVYDNLNFKHNKSEKCKEFHVFLIKTLKEQIEMYKKCQF